ncbi:DNA repair protein RecN [Aquella oligotrophica]|uniref:DNA repair protein RecN n=1 Tax=Aquella oligotrophica TaxID=2067065 RepID=A0A2I7N9F1_9NEIS|nr:DNA repair protein RecN [Aquella oligotrophica]AUR53051.1 DNA repair protein RecN [Aquella oligotrophica]
MLTSLQVKDYLLIDELDIDFYSGLTVITGETGSGKSISIDALMLIFGAKASAEMIRSGQKQASFTATFQVDSELILSWLAEREFIDDNQQNIVICRRVIDANGRSKSFINSIPVNLSILKELGEMLLDIHTQHASIALLKPENQRKLLDEFAGVTDKVTNLAKVFSDINNVKQKIEKARQFSQDILIRQEILTEKLNDLKELDLAEGEWDELQIRQKQLANAGFLLQELDFAVNLVSGEQNSIADILGTLDNRLAKINDYLPNSQQISQLISSMESEVAELEHELQLVANKIEQDPEQLAIVDARIDEIYSLARKYRIRPEEIQEHQQIWQQDLDNLSAESDLDKLLQELEQKTASYMQLAIEISESRIKTANKLGKEVSQLLNKLAINGEFKVNLTKLELMSSFGLDDIQYQVCFNKGMPLQPLNKVASGGELSRVTLALYVILSINNPPEVIVFDEIDVGIGGGVAEVVGTLLAELGKSKQVICITHQPQTACCGNYHLRVSKEAAKKTSFSRIEYVSDESRIGEIARMLGGLNITETTLQHAREMLGSGV